MSDDDFMARWSRRKRAVAEESETPATAEAPPAREEMPEGPTETETEEEALARLGLPDPDTLTNGDDFTGFLKAGVPEVLRRRALRRLWRTNPVFANLDGLVEYGENYADPKLVPEVVATAYKVGKGFLREIVEEDEVDEVAEAAPPVAPGPAVVPPTGPVAQVEVTPEPEPEVTVENTEEIEPEPDDAPLRPRRMRFDVS